MQNTISAIENKTKASGFIKEITEKINLSELKDIISEALEADTFDEKMAQRTIDWLKNVELKALQDTRIPIKERQMVFKSFSRAIKTYGTCTVSNKKGKELIAEIRITKYLKVKGNAEAIIDTLAHEVLHGLLPYEEIHGFYFKVGMLKINKETGLNITITSNEKTNATPKYQVYCPSCENICGEYYRKTGFTELAEQIHCSKCGHSLKVKTLR